MKKLFLYIPAMMLLAVSCEKEAINPSDKGNVKMITEIVSGSRGDDTKTTIGNDTPTFAWTAGDKVAVHVSNGSSAKYVVTTGGASAAAASAQFTVEYEEGYSRDAFAVYPSNLVSATASNYGQSGSTLDISLPGTYTLAQVSGETSPCPMIATNTPGGGWSFKQLCGLLRLTVNSIPASTKRMQIDFDGKKVWGEFSIADPTPGSSSIATTGDDAHDVITITNSGEPFYSGWGDGKVFNIPLPVGTYSNITITTYDALSGGNATLTVSRKFAYSATRTKGVKRTASFPVFSVNSARTTRVIFAPGNLQATTTDLGATWIWSFAEHQYDYMGSGAGSANGLITDDEGNVSANGTVDLFLPSNSAKGHYGITKSCAQGSFIDWGKISTFSYKGVTKDYGSTYWRTLYGGDDNSTTKGPELTCVFKYRGGSYRFTLAKVNTDATAVNGIILFPDNYEGSALPAGVDIKHLNEQNFSGVWSNCTTCTSAGWLELEKAGCVFLPASGKRSNGGTSIDYVGTEGGIRVNPPSLKKYFYYTRFSSSSNGISYATGNAWAVSVRLVHVVQ